MTLTYAGVPLTVPESEDHEAIQTWMDTWTDFEFNDHNWPGADIEGMTFAQHDWPTHQPQLGVLYWPFTAMKFAVGHFVCTGNQLAAIRAAMPPVSSAALPQPLPFVMSTATNAGDVFHTINTKLFMLPPRPYNQITGNPRQWYLLTLVDERYYWWYRDCGNILISFGTRWVDLYDQVAQALGIPIIADPVNANYFFPDPAFTNYFQAAPIILDAIAYNCGQRIVRALDGSVNAVNNDRSVVILNGNIQNVNNQGAKILGGSFQRINDFAYAIPAEVHNVTPVWASSVPSVLTNIYHVESRRLVEFAQLGATLFGFNGQKTFHDTFHGDESLAFAPEATLCYQVALDYWSRFLGGYLDIVLDQPLNVVPDGLHDYSWTYTIEEISTTIRRPSWNWEPDTLLHGDGNGPFYGNSVNEPWQVQPFFAEITGGPTGTAYPWEEVIPQTGGTFGAKPDNQRTGTAALNPGYEFNGSTTVAPGTIVLMWRGFQNAAAKKQEWLFAVATGGGGGGTITVQESDGTPICGGISVLKADSASMIVTCNGGGVATITVKTHSQTVVTGITSVVCNEDGTITVNFTTATVNVVG